LGRTIVCESDVIEVAHPVYGCVPRLGWAKAQKGKEHSFYVKILL
jgi:hypothetical protein